MDIVDPDSAQQAAFVLAERYDPMEGPWHAHRRAQLVHASIGMLTVHTDAGMWVVPPQHGMWIVPGVRHRVTSRTGFWLRTLYLKPDAAELPDTCRVVDVDPLMDGLLAAAAAFGQAYPTDGPEERLVQVMLDRLPTRGIALLHLPAPRDPRLRRIVDRLSADLADACTLEDLAASAGLAARSAARLFRKETGSTFGHWRQQLRLLHALERLGAGASVTDAAFDVGYNDVSSFITVFKNAFGRTPGRFFANRESIEGEG